MKKLILLLLLPVLSISQTFNYSGYVYNANEVGISGVPIKLYKRTTPNISGFTSQTNYNGHSYYRSVAASTWTVAQQACTAMGGHLVTISNAAENNFVFSQWSSGWIGYYQDKTGAFYSEPNAGWRWTENYVTTNQQADYDVASYTSGTTLTDIKGAVNATLYNSPIYTSGAGKYLTFNGVNQYAITGNLGSKVNTNLSLLVWIYPTGNGVIIDELGAPSTTSVWHDSQIEITGGNTLKMALWGQVGSISTPITLNAWHLVGFTYDGTTLTGFKDGASFASAAVSRQTPQQSGNGLYYGIGLSDATNLGSGAYGAFRLGDFQVYSSALTADEMNRNYMSTAWRFGVYPYSNWNPGEPNDSGGEDFIQFVGGGLWNDLPNSYSYQYVLEFDYVVTTTPWVLDGIIYTDATGKYTINKSTNPSIEWYMAIDSLLTPPVTNVEAQSALTTVLTTSVNAKKYYLQDVNNDSKITVSDSYYIFGMVSGKYTNWINPVPKYRLFTNTEWNVIKTSNLNLKATYPGVQSYTISSPVSGGSTDFHLIRTGFTN